MGGLAGCAADEPEVLVPDDGVIAVVGSRPTGNPTLRSGTTTRAATVPQLPGGCNADRLAINSVWHVAAWGIQTQSLSNFKEQITVDDIPLPNLAANSRDRWQRYPYSYTTTGTHSNYCASRAMAYTAADKDRWFTYNTAGTPDTYDLTLKTEAVSGQTEQSCRVPEIFYGNILIAKDHADNRSEYAVYGDSTYCGFYNTGHATVNTCLKGSIYRVVGQINLSITNVPANVKSLQLLCSNMPRHMLMSGSHGAFYPVTAAKTDAEHLGRDTWTVVAEELRRQQVKLSTFMLPTEQGFELMLRVVYTDDTTDDFVLQPTSDVLLSGQQEVYTGVGTELKTGNDFFIFNTAHYLFYMYSNVRVNLSGDYFKLTIPTQDVDLKIEVEPGFVMQHDFEVI